MSIDTRVRWAARHGLAGLVIRGAARRGYPDARLYSDPAVRADPFATYDLLRAAGPFYRGLLSLSTAHHAVSENVLRSDAFGVRVDRDRTPRVVKTASRVAARKKTMSPVDPPSMLAVDPPDHTRYRRLVTRVFTPRSIEALRPRVEELADDLLDALAAEAADGRPVDLVRGYAELLPVTVIAEILGVPTGMRDQFLAWGNAGAVTLDIGIPYRTWRAAERAIDEFYAWTRDHFAQLRRQPGEDLCSRLLHAADDEGKLDEDELCGIVMLLLGAGFETTVNLLGNGTVLLVEHADQLTALLDDPAGWPNAVEEVLRYDSPVQRTARIAMRDTVVAGVAIPAGSFVITMLAGANRDPAVFDDPHRFDVTRPNARENLSFSAGIHYCLGAALARMEGEIGLRKLFERYPDLALAGEPRRRQTRTLRGYDTLPVRLARTRAAATAPVGGP